MPKYYAVKTLKDVPYAAYYKHTKSVCFLRFDTSLFMWRGNRQGANFGDYHRYLTVASIDLSLFLDVHRKMVQKLKRSLMLKDEEGPVKRVSSTLQQLISTPFDFPYKGRGRTVLKCSDLMVTCRYLKKANWKQKLRRGSYQTVPLCENFSTSFLR